MYPTLSRPRDLWHTARHRVTLYAGDFMGNAQRHDSFPYWPFAVDDSITAEDVCQTTKALPRNHQASITCVSK
ncbi:hypothetical protein G6F60_006241 [Rhizopus arrhizus]|nr:hypothetical protein G6F61_001153 [Rhizopus arrhizus]KAG1401655.1 hypothetical protein G6F60_006241 [Rhizopus arrhizus]